MDYTKVAEAETYFESVQLLRPLIERIEAMKDIPLYKIEIQKFADKSVWVNFMFDDNSADPMLGYETVITLRLYKQGRHQLWFITHYGEKSESDFYSSERLDERLNDILSELGND